MTAERTALEVEVSGLLERLGVAASAYSEGRDGGALAAVRAGLLRGLRRLRQRMRKRRLRRRGRRFWYGGRCLRLGVGSWCGCWGKSCARRLRRWGGW